MAGNQINNYINHIVFVIDESWSMNTRRSDVITVFDNQIKYLSKRSQELNQETRVSVYLFSDKSRCIIYDMDVMRLPSLKAYYNPDGNTALVDATTRALNELAETAQRYGDHAFLVYALTDGEENCSTPSNKLQIANKIATLPSNWTVAVLVPNATGIHEAKKFGFPASNIQVWSTDVAGLNKVGETIRIATDNFMTGRAKGIRGTKTLFDLDASKLTTTAVATSLSQLAADKYLLVPVHVDSVIKPCVESWTKTPYIKGSAYYQLVKAETIQAYKQLCVQDKVTGAIYVGVNARNLLGLPAQEVKVNPANVSAYNIFVQSTSVNRKLPKGTQLIVLK